MNTKFNNQEPIVVGLDIGTTKICAIVARVLENNKLEIIGSGTVPSRGVQDGEVKNIIDTSDDIRAACELASQNSGVPIHEVFVGVAGAHIKSSSLRLGFTRVDSKTLITAEELKILEEQIVNLNREPGVRLISYQPQEYFVDQRVPINNNPVGTRGSRLEVSWHTITGNETSSHNIEDSVSMAGLKLVDLDLEPLASAAAVLTREQIDEGVCLVDIGGGTTDVAIFTDGIIRHTAIIPYAGEYITKTIQEKLKLKYKAAKKLKESSVSTNAMYDMIPENKILVIDNLPGMPKLNYQQRQYCKIVHSCLEFIFNQVKSEIYSSHYKDKLNAGIVITGGGAMIPGLQMMVTRLTGYHTCIGKPITKISNLKDQKYAQTLFSTGIGLTLLAANRYRKNNVVNQQFFEEEKAIEEETIMPIQHDTTKKPYINFFDKMKKSINHFLIDEETYREFDE